jgi:hypothetical protein
MLTIQEAFVILANLVRKGASAYHVDYEHVTKKANLYRQLITGVGAEELLTAFAPRETEAAKAQRINITQLTTKPLAGSIMQPFYQPGRLDNIKRFIGYKSEAKNADVRTQELEASIATFWGNESLEEYIAQRFPSLSFLDPNAFLVTEFAEFDARYSKATPYPVEITCHEAVDFRYKNNVIEYLIVKQSALYVTEAGNLETGEMYLMYLPNDILKLTQVAQAAYLGTGLDIYARAEVTDPYFVADSTRRFRLDRYEPKAGRVQAKRIGYLYDAETNGRTFVNPFDNALPYFKKAIKRTSELDLTFVLHVFPQKIFYAEACPGERVKLPAVAGQPPRTSLSPCTAGINTKTGKTCKTCQGAGVVTHTSAQDALAVTKPKPGEVVNVKLDDYVVYKAPPVELLKVMAESLRDVENDARRAVYNSEQIERVSGPKLAPDTATGETIDREQFNNTIGPFAKHCASFWRWFVELIAEFTDNAEDLVTVREYPTDLKPKTLKELYAERKDAVDAGLPYHMIQAIDADISAKMFVDNELANLKFKVKQRFTPFLGKSAEELALILTTGRARKLDEVLWSHGDTIFDELETEAPDLYRMTPEKQWLLIKPKAEAIIAELELDNASALDLGPQLATTDETVPAGDAGAADPSASAKLKLRTSVGASVIVRQARLDIRDGLASREDAIAQLVVQLGYTEAEADTLIGSVKAIQAAV